MSASLGRPTPSTPSPWALARWLRAPLAVWRLLRMGVHILWGLAQVYTVWPSMDASARARRLAHWSRGFLKALGVRLVTDGTPRPGAKLIVANHISWLDIIAINSVIPSRFVSKAEVGQWPVVGRLVTAAGTLYLVRERRRDAARVLGLMARALREGDTVAVFPEGTTGAGHDIMHFHANLVQAAIDAPAPVQPVVIHYDDANELVSTAPAYIGELGMLESLWLVATAWGLTVRVSVMTAQSVEHADRRAITERLHDDMSAHQHRIRDGLRKDRLK